MIDLPSFARATQTPFPPQSQGHVEQGD